MDDALAIAVRTRAGRICEYCQLPQRIHPGPFEIEHVVAKKHGGPTILSNLAFACLHCNKHKGSDLAGIDYATSRTKLVRLFNPRRHKWERHFRWHGPILVGRTAIWFAGVLQTLALDYPPPAPTPLASLSAEREYHLPWNGNWANNLKQIGLIETPLPLVLDKPDVEKIRITEKTALLTSTSTAFKDDEAKIRAAIQADGAEIFTEKKSGIEPARRWHVEIGVHPDKFDDLVDRLRTIGSLSSITVEQKDRTSEFRKLHAQRQSLKKYLDSITKLREGKNPSLEDALKLEQKIQDIEKELQGLGVQFGELLGKESYYHIHVTLVEHQPGDNRDRTYTIGQRIGSGFVWAITWWFGAALAFALAAATCFSVRVLRQKAVAS